MKIYAASLLFALMATVPSGVMAQTSEQIREAQILLEQVDRNPGPIDGIWGARTQSALENFLAEKDIKFEPPLTEDHLHLLRNARVGPRYANRPHTANGRPIRHVTQPSGYTIFPDFSELPQFLSPPPNDITLERYFQKWLSERTSYGRYQVNPGSTFKKIRKETKRSSFLEHQLRFNSIVSYLYFENDTLIYDAKSPDHRFDRLIIDNNTDFRSQSVGKSVVSYLLGHAICEGYIQSKKQTLADWPIMEDTLYENQPLLNLLNMRARDQHVVTEDDGLLETGRWFNNYPIEEFANNELKGSSMNRVDAYNYNGLLTNIIFNYIIFKTGSDWQDFFDRIFQNRVKIENPIFFQRTRNPFNLSGDARYMFYATRYDYLRIAIAMLNDWRERNCVGEYLRSIYKSRQSMNHRFNDPNRMTDVAKGYGGQFLFDFDGMRSRVIFGMNGNNGQNMVIDMENGRIVVTNSIHTNFDWRNLVYDVIRNGDLRR